MRPRIRLSLAALLSWAWLPSPASPAEIVGALDNGDLIQIDPVTGAKTPLGSGFTSLRGFHALARDSAGNLWGITQSPQTEWELVQVDQSTYKTASSRVTLAPGGYTGLAISPGGTFYTSKNGSNGYELWTIDPSTGATTFVGAMTGQGGVGGLDFDPNGVLYAWFAGFAGAGLVRVDTATGAVTDVQPNFTTGSGTPVIMSITFAPGGTLYGIAHPDVNGVIRLYTISTSPTSGQNDTLSEVGSGFILGGGIRVEGIEFIPSPPPPPDACAGVDAAALTAFLQAIDATPGHDMTGPTTSANEGRRGALINRISEAHELVASADIEGALDALRSALSKMDGEGADWIAGTTAASGTAQLECAIDNIETGEGF